VRLRYRYLFDSSTWKYATIIGQAIGSVLLANEAVTSLTPDVFIDTLGMGFIYPWVNNVTDCRVISYTHYPFIQEDMLKR